MKKRILLLASIIPSLIFAQSLSLSWQQGDIPNNSSITIPGIPSDPVLNSHIFVTNNTSSTIDVKVKKVELSLVAGSMNTFCWGICFPPDVYVSPDPLPIGPGATNTDDFIGDYFSNGNLGASIIRYVFFDSNNVTDTTCVNVIYDVSGTPQITAVAPDQGEQGDQLTVTISGQNTHFTQASQTVWFSQGSSTIFPLSFNAISDESLMADFVFSFDNPPGPYSVKVQNPVDGQLALPGGFYLNVGDQPYLTSVDPEYGHQEETLEVTISGQNTHFSFVQATPTTVWFQQGSLTVYPLNFEVQNDNTIQASFHFNAYKPVGLYDVGTYDYIDGELLLPQAFELMYQPSVNILDPDSAEVGYSVTVYAICGYTHLEDVPQNEVWLQFGNEEIISNNVTVYSSIALAATFDIPDGATLGYWDFCVQNDIDGLFVMQEGFHIYDFTGAKEVDRLQEFTIAPNPATDRIQIDISFLRSQSFSIEIVDLMGRRVMELYQGRNADFSRVYNISGLNSGTYFLNIREGAELHTKKFVVE